MPKMIETDLIWVDGDWVPWAKAMIHLMSHGLHYASSVFEGIVCRNTDKGPAIFRLKEHLERLFNSAKIYRMEIFLSPKEISQIIIEAVQKNKREDVYIRPIVWRGYSEIGVNPLNCPTRVAIVVIGYVDYLGERAKEGIETCFSSWCRPPANASSLAKDSAKYAIGQQIKMEAIERGFVEGIALTSQGNISEGSGENIFFVANDTLYTPPISDGILPGITRDCIIKLAKEEGIEVREESLPRSFAFLAQEAFFTGTWAGVVPIAAIDNRPVGNGKLGPLTQKLRDLYNDILFARSSRHQNWLTFLK